MTEPPAENRDLEVFSSGKPDQTIATLERMIRQGELDPASYDDLVRRLADAFLGRYRVTGDVADLRRSVANRMHVVDHDRVPAADRAHLTDQAAQGLRELGRITSDRDYLDEARERHRQSVRDARNQNPGRLPEILAQAAITEATARPTPAGLRAAIALRTEAVRSDDGEAQVVDLVRTWRELVRRQPEAARDAASFLADEPLDDRRSALARAEIGILRAECHEHLDLSGTAADEYRQALHNYDWALDTVPGRPPAEVLDIAWRAAKLFAVEGVPESVVANVVERGLAVVGRDPVAGQQAEQLVGDAARFYLTRDDPEAAIEVLGRADRRSPSADRPGAVHLFCAHAGGGGFVAGTKTSWLAPQLTFDAAEQHRRTLRRTHEEQRGFARALSAVGAWLGESLLDGLDQDQPDILLVPHGPLADLPFRAARRGRRYLLRGRPFAVSAGGNTPSWSFAPARAVAIPDWSPVDPFRTAEIEALAVDRDVEVVDSSSPRDVLTAMAKHSLVHVGLRAGERGFRLAEGEQLTADLITRSHLDGAVVFLAGCATAHPGGNGSHPVPDLLRAFLSAGASAVVAPVHEADRYTTIMLFLRLLDELRHDSPPRALARAQDWLAGAKTDTQAEYLREIAGRRDSPGLSALLEAVDVDRDQQRESARRKLWTLFAVHV